jgi:hypothetical protein
VNRLRRSFDFQTVRPAHRAKLIAGHARASSKLHLHGWPWSAAASFNLNTAGYVMVGLFLAVCALAVLVWRLARLETRCQAPTAEENQVTDACA